MAKTKIQWTDETDNVFVVRGENGEPNGWYCEKVSEGCKFCYAERLNGTPFYGGNGLAYTRPSKWQDMPELMIRYDILERWMTKKAPKRRFVNSMTDTFGEFIPDEWLDTLFAYMALSPTQTFQVLTKRAERMFRYFNKPGVDVRIQKEVELLCRATGWCPPDLDWPLPNVWLGVSVENQARADERIPYLLTTPAAVRFLSVEPLLGPVDLMTGQREPYFRRSWLEYNQRVDDGKFREETYNHVDWVIVGGESGPNARPMHPDWARAIRDQCKQGNANIPFFFKQWGEWIDSHSIGAISLTASDNYQKYLVGYGPFAGQKFTCDFRSFYNHTMVKVGKGKAGRLLDGREWNEFPGDPTPSPSPSKATERGV